MMLQTTSDFMPISINKESVALLDKPTKQRKSFILLQSSVTAVAPSNVVYNICSSPAALQSAS
jgi:hypothetical protein